MTPKVHLEDERPWRTRCGKIARLRTVVRAMKDVTCPRCQRGHAADCEARYAAGEPTAWQAATEGADR